MKNSIKLFLLFLFVPVFSLTAQNAKELKASLQEGKAYYTPQLTGSNPASKPAAAKMSLQRIEKKPPVNTGIRSSKKSSSSMTWPQLKSYIDANQQELSNVTVYSGILDQRAPQIVSDGTEMFIAFESYDTQSGFYPYGTIEIYHSLNDGSSWSFFTSMDHPSFHLYSPQITIVGNYIVVTCQYDGLLYTARWNRSDLTFYPVNVPSPAVSATEFIIGHKMTTDFQEYFGTPYIYMASIFKQADGKNRILFSISMDTAYTWEPYELLGLSQSELNAASVGLDFSSSGLYLAYLGTDTSAGSILMRKSTDFGSTWTPEIKLPMFFNGGLNKKVGPMISAIGSRVAVAYQYDYYGDATDWKTGSDFDIYAVVTNNGGVAWEERMVNSTYSSEILPGVTTDYDGNFYVSYIRDGRVRVSMAGQEYAFGAADSSLIANASLDDFTSIYGSPIPYDNTAYTTWTEVSNSSGLDILGAVTALKIPPTSPINLISTVVTNTEIKLTWTDNSSDESGFAVYYRQAGTADIFEKMGTVGTNITTFTVTGLTPSMGYEFYVRAFNTNGYSLRTNIETAIPSGGTTIPRISDFNPESGPVGTTVTITGTNFSSTAANNIVYFGAVTAQVISSNSTSLKVTVPVGATYQPITVTTNGLTAYSNAPFIVTFASGGAITSSSFATKVDFAAGSNSYCVAIGDIDGDGKPDLAVTNYGSNTVSVFRNTSISGSVSFAAKVDFTVGSVPNEVVFGDIDGDGKLDMATGNQNSNTVSVFRNTSSSGSISFAAKVEFTSGSYPAVVHIYDIDGDGKSDIVTANAQSNNISVFRNTSSPGSITSSSFAAKVDFTTGSWPNYISISDIDGDSKPDIAVSNAYSNNVSVFRNTSSSGSISFAAKVDFLASGVTNGVALGDIDGDEKPDLVLTDNSLVVSVFRNTSSLGSITSSSFAPKVDFASGLVSGSVYIGDIDGDGKSDLLVSYSANNTLSVFKNTSSSGSITTSSLASKVDFATGQGPSYAAIGDMDGDGKPDIVVANTISNTVSVFRNMIVGSTIVPAAPRNLSATPGNGSATLIWNRNLESDFLKYRIYYGTIISSSVTLKDSTSGGAADTTKTITGLTNGTAYSFRITAVNNAGIESGFSNAADVTPIAPADNTPPTITLNAPTGTPVIVNVNGQVGAAPQVSATAADGESGVYQIQVAYRNTSEQTWSYSARVNANTINYGIPTTAFVLNNKPVGVNYRIGAWDNAGNVSWSPFTSIDVKLAPQAADQPSFTMPAASSLDNKTTAYRIVSVPYNLTNMQPANLLTGFGSHSENSVSYARWRFQRYVGTQYQDYDQFSTENVITPGAAFFFIVRDQGSQITVQGESIVRSDIMYNNGIAMQNGWNIIGNPFTIPYPIDSLEFYNASSVRAPIRQHAYYSGTGPVSGWDTASASVHHIQPWSGVALFVNSTGTLKFPSTGQSSGLPKISMPQIEKVNAVVWTLAVNAYRTDINMRCEGSTLGMAQGAYEGDDPYDSYMPPIIGDKNVALYFKNADGAMMRDIRPMNGEGSVWEMRVVTGDANARVKLQWSDKLNLPNSMFEAYLFDIDLKTAHNLKETQSLEVNSGSGVRNFRVVIGKKSYVEGNNAGVALTPSSIKLYANYPNPFNPETVIRYNIPGASASYMVTLKVFNVLGQEVAILVNEQKLSGYYEVKFNGINQSSGVYFYQLSITDGSKTFQEIKKMVLMK